MSKDYKIDKSKEFLKCSVDKKYTDGSCFTLESLKKIALSYNEKIKNIKENDIKKYKLKEIQIVDDKKILVKEITKKLKHLCKDQLCWLKQDFVQNLKDDEINEFTFRPRGPNGKFEWLSTTNINEIIQQYEKKYNDFEFLGAVPIDFDDLPDLGFRNINFDDYLNKKKTKFGVVFNLDEHWKNGSHWVSLYFDILQNKIYYFDSYGFRPEKRIRRFINRISKWCYKHNIVNENLTDSHTEHSFMHPTEKNYIEKKLHVEYNKIRHQFKHSECGVYSVNFILRLLNNHSFHDICNNPVNDDKINKCRDVYFRFS
jgi:hypothetical protein